MKNQKKYKVTFLLDNSNLWIENYLKNENFKYSNKYIFKITKKLNSIRGQDIVFPLSYTKILSDDFLNKNKLTLIVHPSKLPRDKGFAPVQYQVLKKKNKIFVSLIKAEKEVDSGNIYLREYFLLKGYELSDEIRKIQAKAVFNIIKSFLNKYPKLQNTPQTGQSNFNLRRTPRDSELNINKTIKSQFNLLRICDNNLHPAFFYHQKKKYILKIFREE
jgi:methionyl-tRNA formyltransferase